MNYHVEMISTLQKSWPNLGIEGEFWARTAKSIRCWISVKKIGILLLAGTDISAWNPTGSLRVNTGVFWKIKSHELSVQTSKNIKEKTDVWYQPLILAAAFSVNCEVRLDLLQKIWVWGYPDEMFPARNFAERTQNALGKALTQI